MNEEEKKSELTSQQQLDCDRFKQIRLSYNMTQEEWAAAIGVSHILVRRIEEYLIACSDKTKSKVQQFVNHNHVNQDIPELHNLESHILYDILLTHMKQIPKRKSNELSGQCTKVLQDIISASSKCDTPEAQETYFRFLHQLLTTLQLAISDVTDSINNGVDVLNINTGLKEIFQGKQITKYKKSTNASVDGSGNVAFQYDLLDWLKADEES